MSKEIQIREAIENAEANVNYLASLPDRALAEKLELIHLQTELAEKKKNTSALELLQIWRSQIIEARIHKYENNIPDAVNEIQEAIADIETTTAKLEERKEILSAEEPDMPEKEIRQNLSSPPERLSRAGERATHDTQLPLF